MEWSTSVPWPSWNGSWNALARTRRRDAGCWPPWSPNSPARATRDPRPARAAAEAEAIARRLSDPGLLALALTAGTMVVNYEREPERRAHLAAELGQIGHEHGLPEYKWYAEYIAGTAAAVLGCPPRA